MSEETTTFENTTQGWVGAIKVRRNGDRDAVPVGPGERIELDAEEQLLTANAPRLPEDNPFIDRPFKDYDQAGDVIAEGVRPQLRECEPDQRHTPAGGREVVSALVVPETS